MSKDKTIAKTSLLLLVDESDEGAGEENGLGAIKVVLLLRQGGRLILFAREDLHDLLVRVGLKKGETVMGREGEP